MAGYERLKSVGGGGRYDALASDGRTTYPGVGVSFGVSRTLIPLFADGVLAPGPKVPSTVLVALVDEESRGASEAVADRAARPRHRHRGGRVRAEVRQADPVRRAPRHPVRLVPRTSRRGQGHPQRRAGRPPTRPPGHHRRPTHQRRQSSDPHPRRRLAARRARRPDRDAGRLGGPPPRPRRRHLHRPARGQRRRPGRRPRRGRRPPAAQRVLPQGHRRGRPAPGGQRQPRAAHRRGRGGRRPTLEVLSAAAPLPFPIDDHVDGGRGGRGSSTATSTCAVRRPTHAIRLRSKVNKAARDVLDDARLRRDRDADADPVARPRAPATSWCRPGCGPAAGTPCRRARSCSSSC